MLAIASQIILCLILAAIIGGIIGYLLGKSTCGDDSCHEAPEVTNDLHIDKKESAPVGLMKSSNTVEKDSTEEEGIKPELLTEAREGGKDNLQLIKGVGKVLEQLLNDNGVYHFDQIASWSEEEVKWMDKQLSFPGRIVRENWIAQSKDLAEGKDTEFSERVKKGEVATSKKS